MGDPLTRERPDGPHQEYLRAASDHESMGKGDTSTVIYLRVKLLARLSQIVGASIGRPERERPEDQVREDFAPEMLGLN